MLSRYFDEDEPINIISGIDTYWHSPLVSLESATRSLLDIIPNIGDLVTRAKMNCFKSPHGLTHDESAAIYLYTMELGNRSVYKVLNRVLRANNNINALPWFSYLKLLATGIKKLPSYAGNVWRAVDGDVAKCYKKNTTVRWWAFTSCTKSISILKQFVPKNGNDGTIFMIECVTGKDISAYSFYTKEDEIILMSGTMLLAMDESLPMNEIHVVHLKEIPVAAPSSARLIRSFSSFNLHTTKKPMTPIPSFKPTLVKEATMPSIKLLSKSPAPYRNKLGKRFHY
jgi:hypothetical protein